MASKGVNVEWQVESWHLEVNVFLYWVTELLLCSAVGDWAAQFIEILSELQRGE